MGGAVSSGRDNNELIDNLMSGNYIRTKQVEEVFRALDRADYMTPEARDQAYKDLAWRNGPLHLSSPCIYSEVMEGLELRPGLSFLNVGSGTGYLSSLVGLILGTSGISHGVEVHPAVVEYANKKISQFIENSPTLDQFDFCQPKYYHGNGLCLIPPQCGYDRVYCGAACPLEYEMYFKQLIKVGGLLVMPLNDTLLQVRRVAADRWVSRSLLNVSFATLQVPPAGEAAPQLRLEPLRPVRLQLLSRAVVRRCMLGGVLRRHPELQAAPRPAPPAACPRRICIPVEPGGSVEGLNVLHDLDGDSGANEMNALLSLVISMGRSQALRFDRVDSESSDDESGVDAPSSDCGEGDSGESPEDRPADVDLPVSDSEEKSDAKANGDSDDAPAAPRRRRAEDSERRRGRRLRPPPKDDNDERPPSGVAMRELLRKRGDARPSTSTSQTESSVADALTNVEEIAKKETVVENEEKTDNMTGPPKRELPGVPSVVEIDLGERSDMEWDPDDAVERRLVDSGAGDDDVPKSGPKRQKLDDGEGENAGSSSDGRGAGRWSPGPEEVAHAARRRRREAVGGAARRVRLWLLMKQAVRELPLPHALKKFVNLGRCFEF